MGIGEVFGIIGGVCSVLGLVHFVASAPPEKNLIFFRWLRVILLIAVMMAGVYFVIAFVTAPGVPNRAEILNFSIWLLNLTWTTNALIIMLAQKHR